MSFYLHLSLILADLASVRQFAEVRFHELGKVIMASLSLKLFLSLLVCLFLLLLYSLLVGRNHIHEFLSIVYFWLFRIDYFLIVVVSEGSW